MICCSIKRAKKRSTWLIHDADVGVKCLCQRARPFGEPVPDQPDLVARRVVHDEMGVEVGRHVALHFVEEGAELPRPVPLHAGPDGRAGGHVEGGEERGGAVALVVVGAPLHLTWPHGQHRLSAVQHLDLALLVDA